MQQIINVITIAPSLDLMTVDEMKTMLLIPPTDTSKDEMLQYLITDVSETIGKMANRVFGFEEVDETFFQLEDDSSRRLYLSRWPVAGLDLTSLTQNGDDLLPTFNQEWILEEETGTLYRFPQFGPWYGVIDAEYSGGYHLPEDAPGPLKFAAMAVTREAYMAFLRNPGLYGVRQLSHKAARVGFYQPNLFATMGMPGTWKNVQTILDKYIRHWV